MNAGEPSPAPGPSPQPPPAVPSAAAAAPKPRLKRWKKILLIAGGTLAVLALLVLFLGPAVIGSVAAGKISALLGDEFQGAASVGRVSFSWSGRVEIDDLRLVPKNFANPLLEVKRIDLKVDVGSALRGKYIADIEVVAPKLIVEKGGDGKFNYEVPPRPPKAEEPKARGKESGKAPFVQANLKVRDGELKIRGRGRETFYQNLRGTAQVDTLEKPLRYDLSLEGPQKDSLRVTGALDANTLSGPATLTLDKLSLQNLTGAARAYSDVLELDGTLSGAFDYRLQGAPRFAGQGRLEIHDFAVAFRDQKLSLGRLTFSHDGGIDERGNGKHVLTLSSGKALSATLTAEVRDAFQTPLVKAELQADSDLGELGKLLETLIGLKPDIALEGAARMKGSVEAKGADSVTADLSLLASNVVAVDARDGSRHEIDKAIEVKLVGAWDGKSKTATADVLRLDSSFARVDGKGGASLAGQAPEIRETRFLLEADLEKLAGKLRSFMEKPPALGGKARVEAFASGEKMALTGDLKGIRCGPYGPFDVQIHHEGSLDAKGSGRHTIRLDSGKAVAMSITADLREAYKDARALQVDLKLESELSALSRMLPGLLELKPGTTLAGALALSSHAETKGSEWAAFDVAVNVDRLEAVDSTKHQEIDPAIRLKAAGAWDGTKKALSLQTFALTSAFATADARGGLSLAAPMTLRESSLQVQADLDKLGSKLGLFMADAPGLSGVLSANALYAGEKYSLDAAARGVKIVRRGKTLGPIEAIVAQKGTFSPAKDGAFKIETGVVTSSAADLALSGEIRKVMEEGREGEIKLDAVVRPAELSKWVPGLDLAGPEITLATLVSLKPKLVSVSGQTKMDGLSITGKDSTGATLTRTAKTGPVYFSFRVKEPDLQATLRTPSLEWIDKGYSARAGLEAQLSRTEKGVTGMAKLADLEIQDERKNVVKDPGLTLVYDLGLSDQNRMIDLRKAELSSSFLKGTIQGKLRRLDPALELQKLHLAFRYLPDKLGAVVKPWLPGALEGSEEKTVDVTLDGKAASTAPLEVLRAARGGIQIDLATFTLQGLSLSGKAEFQLEDGRLVGGTPLTVNKGKSQIDVVLDFNPAEKMPQSSLTLKAKEVDANGQMGPILEKINPIFHTKGIDAKVDGQIQADFHLTWTGAIDPDEKNWGLAASKSLSGLGTFGAQNLNIAGSPVVGEILSAIGQGNALQGELVASQIRIRGGRCEYDNMTFRGSRKDAAALKRDQDQLSSDRAQLETEKPQLQQREYARRLEDLKQREEDLPFRYSLKFTGWVGFDRKMQLHVLMPMTPGMIKAHPHLQKYLGTSFWVDLGGSVNSPRLDLSKMLSDVAKRAAEGVLVEKATDLLSGLRKNKRREQQAEEAFNQAQQAEAQKDSAGALALYRRLLKDYSETDFVSRKKKDVIEERVRALQGN
jgi:hypothetical protein